MDTIGKFTGIGNKAAGLTDVPFASFYRELGVDYGADMKARQMLGKGASKQDISDMRDDIIRNLDDHPEIELAAHEFALRETLNNDNQWAKIAASTKQLVGVPAESVAGKSGRDATDLIMDEFVTRFTKVIGNVVTDSVDRTGGFGAVRGVALSLRHKQLLKEGAIRQIPLDKRLQINELISKGLVGVALTVMGTYMREFFKQHNMGELIPGKVPRFDYGTLSQIGGPAIPLILGDIITQTSKMKPEEGSKVLASTLLTMPINTPIASNLRQLGGILENPNKFKTLLARKIVALTGGSAAGDITAAIDRGSIFDTGGGDKRQRIPQTTNPYSLKKKNSTDFMDILSTEYKYKFMPWELPLKQKPG